MTSKHITGDVPNTEASRPDADGILSLIVLKSATLVSELIETRFYSPTNDSFCFTFVLFQQPHKIDFDRESSSRHSLSLYLSLKAIRRSTHSTFHVAIAMSAWATFHFPRRSISFLFLFTVSPYASLLNLIIAHSPPPDA